MSKPIWKNEEALSNDYLPESLPHRETQIQQIANNIERVGKGKMGQNTFVFGSPGIGKTACVKFIFREFENFSGIKPVYVNTWDYKTSAAVLAKITQDLGVFVARRGVAKDEIMERLIEVMNKSENGIVICLDEVDQVIKKDENVIYDLLRINQYVSKPVVLVMISNYKDVFALVDPRIKSSLDIEEIGFKSYNLQEMKNILTERCKSAFHFGTLEEGVTLLCANIAVNKGGDVRAGLEILRKAGRLAEESGSDKTTVSHVRHVIPDVKNVKLEILYEKLDNAQKNIIEVLKEKGAMESTKLLNEYVERFGGISDTALRSHVVYLEKVGLIRTNIKKRGVWGRKYFIKLEKKEI